MPSRALVAKELGALLKMLSHPDRILVVHLLANGGALSVTEIGNQLDLPATRISQHLALLRAFRIVAETSEGRQRIYSLAMPTVPTWLLDGIEFIAGRVGPVTSDTAAEARQLWMSQHHAESPQR
ncbi:MAG: metalloregulator ArsR/SmtB family transcription factor [Pseudomonadota bacterium]